MKLLPVIVVLALLVCCAYSARKKRLGKKKTKGLSDDVRGLVRGVKSDPKGKSGKDKKGNSLRKRSQKKFQDGKISVTRMDQLYEGVRVFGSQVIDIDFEERTYVPVSKKSKLLSKLVDNLSELRITAKNVVSGNFVDEIENDLKTPIVVSKRKQKRALRLCRRRATNKGSKRGDKAKTEVETIVYIRKDTELATEAYHCIVHLPEENSQLNVIITLDGEILEEWDGVVRSTAKVGTGPSGNARIGKTRYGEDHEKLEVTVETRCISTADDGTCLESKDYCIFSTPEIMTVDLQRSTDYWSSSTPFEYPCYEQDTDEINDGYSPLNDAHHFALETMRMFDSWYQANPLKFDEGQPMVINVHYGSYVENAFYDSYNKEVMLGDGYSYFHPLTTLDIVAHEIGHGVTWQNSGLIYSGESGGLNEAFSDMTGMAAVRFSRKLSAVTFKIGDEAVKGSGQLRCMDNPPCDGRSIDHVRDYYDGMDPHYSSGLFNFVFYKLSQVLPYDIWDAYDIFYAANTMFWTSSTGFLEGAEKTLEAVNFLQGGGFYYSYSHLDSDVIVKAFSEVGIECVSVDDEWSCSYA